MDAGELCESCGQAGACALSCGFLDSGTALECCGADIRDGHDATCGCDCAMPDGEHEARCDFLVIQGRGDDRSDELYEAWRDSREPGESPRSRR